MPIRGKIKDFEGKGGKGRMLLSNTVADLSATSVSTCVNTLVICHSFV